MDALAQLQLSRTSSPLTLFLYIYSKASRECYLNYNEGSKAVIDWLTSDGTVPFDYMESKYPEITNPNFKVPRLLTGYEAAEICKILVPRSDFTCPTTYAIAYNKLSRAIYILTTKEVLHHLY